MMRRWNRDETNLCREDPQVGLSIMGSCHPGSTMGCSLSEDPKIRNQHLYITIHASYIDGGKCVFGHILEVNDLVVGVLESLP